MKQYNTKGLKKAKRKQAEDEIEKLLQSLGLDDEVEKQTTKGKKSKKKAKKTKKSQRPEIQETSVDEERQPEYDLHGDTAAIADPSPTQKNPEDKDDFDECTICFEERNPTYMFYPCGHATFCKKCAERLFESEEKKCPDCRTLIKDTIRVFGTIRSA